MFWHKTLELFLQSVFKQIVSHYVLVLTRTILVHNKTFQEHFERKFAEQLQT